MDGEDFDFFNPGDKKVVRKKLGLPMGTKIILYVGLFSGVKGVEIIIRVFGKL